MKKFQLVALACLIALGACTKEDVRPTDATPSLEEVGSTTKTTRVSIDLAAEEEAPKTSGDQIRGLNFQIGMAGGKVYRPRIRMKEESEKKKVLLVISTNRASDPITYHYADWDTEPTRDSKGNITGWGKKLRFVGDIDLLGNTTPSSSKTYYARAILGGEYDANEQRIRIPKENYLIDLTDGTAQQEMELPFASDWVELTQEKTNGNTVLHFKGRLTLKPLGVLMTYSLTNNMDKAVSVEGIRMITNALYREGSFSVVGNYAKGNTWEYTKDASDNTELEALRTYTFWYGEKRTIASKAMDKMAIVAWFMPTGKEAHTDWDQQSYTKTHMYPVAPKDALTNETITKPNYTIVPIMGTDIAFETSKSYVMGCELYEQPKLQLGYMAKWPVNAKKEFVRSGANLNTLVNRGQTQAFYDWSQNSYTAHSGSTVEGSGETYHVPYQYQQAAYCAFAKWDFVNGGRFQKTGPMSLFNSDDPAELQRMGREVEPGNLPDLCSIAASAGGSNNKVAYAINYREADLPAVTGKAPEYRSRHQTITKISRDGTRNSVNNITFTAVYLGKYYIGDVGEFMDSNLWDDATFTLNKVERVLPVVGEYDGDSNPRRYYVSGNDNVDNSVLVWNVGDRTVGSLNRVFPSTGKHFFGLSFGIVGPRAYNTTTDNRFKYRLLWPYSETYQGDTKD